jgi:glycosyltransferase involved in cell wall biosynthesis
MKAFSPARRKAEEPTVPGDMRPQAFSATPSMFREPQIAECVPGRNQRALPMGKDRGQPIRVAFVTNFCPHYRVKTFEMLAEQFDADFYFYSDGSEWYWQKKHGTREGQFRHRQLSGFTFLGTRITATLPVTLCRANHDAIIKCIDGRFALAATYLTARLRQRPFVLWTGIWSAIDTPFHRLVSPLTRYIYRCADAIVVYGEHVKRYLLNLGVAEEKIFVAPHAVDNEHYSRPVSVSEVDALRDKLGLAPADRVVLYLGRLEEIKGLTYLIKAFRQVTARDAVLVVAGDGGELLALRKTAAELGIERRVRFSGYVSPEGTLPYYAMAHVLALPSVSTRYGKELWGLVVNEAMNQGVPIIATDAVGAVAGGLVRNGVDGLVVPERDSVALANAIQIILDSPKLRDEMSRGARRAISEWDNEGMVRGFKQAVEYAMHKDDPGVTSS